MFKTNIKNIVLASLITLGLCHPTKAQNINSYKKIHIFSNYLNNYQYKVDLDNSIHDKPINHNLVTQRIRRKIKRFNKDVYGGLSFGLFLPSSELRVFNADISLNNGFGGSIFAGVKFNKNLGADLEFLLGFGNLDTDQLQVRLNRDRRSDFTEIDGNYTLWSLYFNPRYEIFLSETKNFKIYISPGVGVSRSNSTIEFDTQSTVLNTSRDFEKTGFSFQFKGGVVYPINNNANIFGQVRYANLPAQGDNINLINTEIGIGFEF